MFLITLALLLILLRSACMLSVAPNVYQIAYMSELIEH